MRRATLVAFSLSVLLPSSTQTLLIPAIPTLTEERGFSLAANGWMLSAFLVGASISAPLVGRIGDLRGRRPLMLLVSVAYVVGAAICLVGGENSFAMAVGRAFQGVSAGVYALHISTIQQLVASPVARATNIGILAGVVATGPAVGFVLGGVVTAKFGVSALFVLGMAAGCLSTAMLWRYAPASGGAGAGAVDGRGAALVALSLLTVLAWLTEIGVSGVVGPRTLVMLGASALTVVGTVRWLRRVEEPFIDLDVLTDRIGALGNTATVLSACAMFGLFVAVPQLVQDGSGGLGLGPVEAGLFLVPGAVVMVLAAPVASAIGARRGHGEIVVVGNVICATGLLALGLVPHAVIPVLVLATVVGLGVGVAFPALPSVVMNAAPRGAVGVAAGINSLSRGVGSAVGAQVVLLVSAASTGGGVDHRAAFLVSAAGGAAAALVAVAIVRQCR